jgi:hypothetical protein
LLNLNSKRMISRIFYLMSSEAKLDFTLSCNCSGNREMYLYHGRANAIRPYDNGISK